MQQTVTCTWCGAYDIVPLSRAKIYRYCSLDCRNKGYVGGRNKRPLVMTDFGPAIRTAASALIYIDREDTDLNQYSWRIRDGKGATARVDGKLQHMHRIILSRKLGRELLPSEYVDHINRHPYDNRRSNLRLATPTENQRNRGGWSKTSVYKGVYRLKGNKTWTVFLRIDRGHAVQISGFKDEENAAYVYDQFAMIIHGEFACLNVLDPPPFD